MAQARFAAMLADRRRQLGITIGQAARDLCMKERILDAFERGDFASIPNNGYAQSMVGSYARYLGLDDQAVMQQFIEDQDVYEHGNSRDRRRSRDEGRRPYQDRRAPQQDCYGAQQDASYPAGQSQAYGGRQRYQQGRPYTARNPQQVQRTTRRERPYGSCQDTSDFYGSSQRIETRPVEQGYTDDMRYGQTTSPYEAANSAQGRRYSRNIANPQRPNVDRGARRQQRRRKQPQSLFSNQNMVILLGIIVVLVLTLIIVLSVGSCVNHAVGESDDSSSTVPVTTTTSTDTGTSSNSQNSSTQSASSRDSTASSQTKSTNSTTSATTTTPEKTEVVVTVSDSSVSWIEITVDGKSMVADTVTGPWTQTYDPTDTMSIQVGDTSAVTVTKNGVTQAFDTKTSGLGTLTIKVPQTAAKTANGSNAAASSSDGTGTATGSAGMDASAGASDGTGTTSNSASGTSGTAASSGAASSTQTSLNKGTSTSASAGAA